MSKDLKLSGKTLVIVASILFLSINFIVQTLMPGAKLDMTENKLYTLSEGTEQILADMDDPIDVNFYFSEELATPYPTIFRYGKRVKETLESFAALSDGMVRLRTIDPEPFSEVEDKAVAAGIQGIDTGDGQKIYLGLSMEDTTDRETIIPFFPPDRERFLEYDLVKALYSLVNDTLPKVTVISSLPLEFGPGGMFAMQQGQSQPYLMWEQLQQFFDVEKLTDDFDAIPADTDLLMLVHPDELSDQQTYLIDQFVLKSGKAIVFTDPLLETAADVNPQNQFGPKPPADQSNLEALFTAWGIKMDADNVVADLELGQRVRIGDGFRGVKEFPHWMGLRNEQMNPDDVVSGVTNMLTVISAGALSPLDGATTTFTPLVTTGDVSSLISANRVKNTQDPDSLVRDFVSNGEKYTVAARVVGEVSSAFDGAPEGMSDDALSSAGDHLDAGQISVMVVADADMWVDRFWAMSQGQGPDGQRYISPISDNGSFVINAVDHLTGTDGLINLRSRGETRRSFVRVDNIRKQAEMNYLAEEQALQQQIQETTARLTALEGNDPDQLSPEQEAEMERFRSQLIDARRALREVQRNLRRDIDALESRLAFFNIAFVPLILLIVLFVRNRRRRNQL